MAETVFEMITTRGGDEGKSTLFNGERRLKSDFIFEVLGDLDELTSVLGFCRALVNEQFPNKRQLIELSQRIEVIQTWLVPIGGLVASPPPRTSTISVSNDFIIQLEAWQKEYMNGLVISRFIQPGATSISAAFDMARAVCRRTERHLVRHIQDSYANDFNIVSALINRLSDFLFVLARYIARCMGKTDT